MLHNLNHQTATANAIHPAEERPEKRPEGRPELTPNRHAMRRWLRFTLIGVLVLLAGFIVNLLLANLLFTGLPTGSRAPLFQGEALDGQLIDLAQAQGQPVMLTFWSPDCFACREELPTLQTVATDPNAGMQLITVVSHTEEALVADFVAAQGLTFPILVDPTGTIAEQYEVSGIPFTYFIDGNGLVDEVVMGAGREGALQDQLSRWLNSCRIDEVCTVE